MFFTSKRGLIYIFFFITFFEVSNSYSIPDYKETESDKLPTVLKADKVDANRQNQTLTAKGNVEISHGSSVLRADEIIYDKNNKKISAKGQIRLENLAIGELYSKNAQISDDFKNGSFEDANLIFNDGSYIKSDKVEFLTPTKSYFTNPIYSFCPNDEIAHDKNNIGKNKDFAVIKSKETEIDQEAGTIKSKHGMLKIFNFPVLYSPYIRTPLNSKERKTGFLFPSYTKSNKFGVGIKTPFYVNIAPNKDLNITPRIGLDGEKFMINNKFRHATDYGDYEAILEIANNKINSFNDTTIVNRSNKRYRWQLSGKGDFEFDEYNGVDFSINTLSDAAYLRDFQDNYLNYSTSKINYDYIDERDYFSAETLRFQELEDPTREKSAQFVLPNLSYFKQFKPIFKNEKIFLDSNLTSVNRQSGLQFNRLSLTPEVEIPYNVKGNLISAKFKLQNDLYFLNDNYKYNETHRDYQKFQANHRPKFALNWSLPLIKKDKKDRQNTILLEPVANFVITRSTKNYYDLPNEDSSDSELTLSNIFSDNFLAGYDRNEDGSRVGYGLKSSYFNKYGEFAFGAGKSHRISNNNQDVNIKGFNSNDKSNYVGQTFYRAKKYFMILYTFQLNENSYTNDLNEVNVRFDNGKLSFVTNYLLIRRSIQNEFRREQINFAANIKFNNRWTGGVSATRNLVSGKIITKQLNILRNGCCTNFGFYVRENNPENFTKAEKTFGINLSFKNL